MKGSTAAWVTPEVRFCCTFSPALQILQSFALFLFLNFKVRCFAFIEVVAKFEGSLLLDRSSLPAKFLEKLSKAHRSKLAFRKTDNPERQRVSWNPLFFQVSKAWIVVSKTRRTNLVAQRLPNCLVQIAKTKAWKKDWQNRFRRETRHRKKKLIYSSMRLLARCKLHQYLSQQERPHTVAKLFCRVDQAIWQVAALLTGFATGRNLETFGEIVFFFVLFITQNLINCTF